MKRGVSLLPAVLAAVLAGAVPAGAAPAAIPDVQVRTAVDRTAVWVADRIVYTIDLVCRPGVDILDEDLSRDKLKLDGLQVVSSESVQATGADGTTSHHYAYTLTSYRVDQPELRVAPFSVRYYAKKPGARLQDAAPAGEAQVPATTIAFRSMLPDQADTAALRDGRPATPRARRFTLAHSVGLGLVVASFAPVLFWVVTVAGSRRQKRVHRSAKQVRAEEEATLESVRSLDLATPAARREAYTRINAVVREHLREACGVAGQSLTPAEAAPALASSRVPGETVSALLAECERARFGPPDLLPSADACRDALAQAEQLLAIR